MPESRLVHPPGPAEVAALAAAPSPRHQMQPGTARQRAGPAAAHAEDVGARDPGRHETTLPRSWSPPARPPCALAHWTCSSRPGETGIQAIGAEAGSFTPRL